MKTANYTVKSIIYGVGWLNSIYSKKTFGRVHRLAVYNKYTTQV